jgi:type VI secretion system protein ImpL
MLSYGDLKSALGLATIISIPPVGSLAVWTLGPEYHLDHQTKVLLTVLFVSLWPVAFVVNHYRKKRAERAESPDAAPAPAGDSPPPPPKVRRAPARRYEPLVEGLADVTNWLRAGSKSGAAAPRPSSRTGRALRWLSEFWRRDELKQQDPIYSRPWILVAGRPDSGKTSLLLSAGLEVQPLPSPKRADFSTLRHTGNVEWLATEGAVLLDTAGRYQTGGDSDRDEWSALIALLKENRDLRPLDGFVVVADAALLAGLSGEEEAEDEARLLRRQLDEVVSEVGIEFPVYLVFTRADDFVGFRDFFAGMTREERAQVWGATIPRDEAERGHALFDIEFDQLIDVLKQRRLERLGLPEPPARQHAIFNFPLLLAASHRNLSAFVSILFRRRGGRASSELNPWLRGFYFTASPGGGAAADPVAAGSPRETAAGRVSREGFFSGRLFKEVLWDDRDLVAARVARRVRPNYRRNVLLSAGALLLLGLAAGVGVSFFGNRELIRDARARGARLEEIRRGERGADPRQQDAATVARLELNSLDGLRETLKTLDGYEHDAPPLRLRFLLYSGGYINRPLRELYFEAVTQRFYKPTVAALERDLRAFVAGPQPSPAASEEELERNYDLLKAYLMLADHTKAEPTHLVRQLETYWQQNAPQEMALVAHRQLEFFAQQAGDTDAPHILFDKGLVEQARRKLLQYPPLKRYYKRVSTEINEKTAAVSVESIVGVRGLQVLGGTYTVPGSFTLKGYREHMREAFKNAPEDISKEDWVMGDIGASESGSAGPDLKERLRQMYFREYAEQWRRFLQGVRVRDFRDNDDAALVLKSLSGGESPMESVMLEVIRNTNLSAPPAGNFFTRFWRGLVSGGAYSDTEGKSEVEVQFRPLFKLVPSPDNQRDVPLSQYRVVMSQLLESLNRAGGGRSAQGRDPAGSDDPGVRRATESLTQLLDGFDTTVAGKDAATLVTQPLVEFRELVYASDYAEVEKIWREQIYPDAHALEAGFPFADDGSAPVKKLAELLNPVNGRLTVFFRDRLAGSFDDVEGRWELKKQGALPLSPQFVEYLNNARRLREALFPGNKDQPDVTYNFILKPVPGVYVAADVDGVHAETDGSAPDSKQGFWPSRRDTSGAILTVKPVGGQASPPPLAYSGEWGVFKLFAAGRPSRTADNQYELSWNVGGVSVRATFQSADPLQRNLFTRLRAPATLEQ